MVNVIVKAVGAAIVYSPGGGAIPNDRFVEVPKSPGIVKAILAGDLEERERKTTPRKRKAKSGDE